MTEKAIPSALLEKRMHSLMGVWLTIYLMLHLFTNSQAAFFLAMMVRDLSKRLTQSMTCLIY